MPALESNSVQPEPSVDEIMCRFWLNKWSRWKRGSGFPSYCAVADNTVKYMQTVDHVRDLQRDNEELGQENALLRRKAEMFDQLMCGELQVIQQIDAETGEECFVTNAAPVTPQRKRPREAGGSSSISTLIEQTQRTIKVKDELQEARIKAHAAEGKLEDLENCVVCMAQPRVVLFRPLSRCVLCGLR